MASRKEREAEELRRRRQARRRFKTLVRLVLYNRTWLLDMEEHQQLTSNVKRNIAMVIRPPRKFGLLTLTEKGLLRTHHGFRSVKDRKHLVTLFAGLTCFQSFSPRLRARLVPFMSFLDLQRNRTILREGAMPQMVYFIIYGEVEIYKNKFDHMTQTYETKLLGMLGTGDCIGEMEFIENVPVRQCTVITSSDTELLVIQGDDFEQILKPIMSQQWEERKVAIKAVQYFDFFTDNQTKQKDGKKTCELVDVAQDNTENIFEDMTEKEIMKMMLDEKMALDTSESDSNEDEKELGITIKAPAQKPMMMNIDALCASKGFATKVEQKPKSTTSTDDSMEISQTDVELMDDELQNEEMKYETITGSSIEAEDSEYIKTISAQEKEKLSGKRTAKEKSSKVFHRKYERTSSEETESKRSNSKTSKETLKSQSRSEGRTKTASFKRDTDQESFHERKSKNWSNTLSSDTFLKSDKSMSIKSKISEESVGKTENYFIDVGAMTFGGIFGLGEKMEHRVIMARTTVQCFMVPRFWLLEKEQNPGNIWQRRRFYLDCTIPSRQNLFKNFLATLKWQKFKNELIQSTVHLTSKTNPTKLENVPIMCRITEDG